MSVALRGDTIVLSGPCRVEDAEPLLSLLQAGPSRTVDLTDAAHFHAAVVQILLAFRPTLLGPPPTHSQQNGASLNDQKVFASFFKKKRSLLYSPSFRPTVLKRIHACRRPRCPSRS